MAIEFVLSAAGGNIMGFRNRIRGEDCWLVLDDDGVTTAPIFELFRFGRVLFLSMAR